MICELRRNGGHGTLLVRYTVVRGCTIERSDFSFRFRVERGGGSYLELPGCTWVWKLSWAGAAWPESDEFTVISYYFFFVCLYIRSRSGCETFGGGGVNFLEN